MTVLGFLIVLVVLLAIGAFVVRKLGLGRVKAVPRRQLPIAAVVLVAGAIVSVTTQIGAPAFFLSLMAAFTVVIWHLPEVGPYLKKHLLPRPGSVNAQLIMPPPWPPRQPADWGRDIQIKYQRAVKNYQSQQSTASAFGIRVAGAPPVMPMIPLWEAHYAAQQAKAPLQIRWAQTETGDWLRVNYGNRMRPPAPGKRTPVFQIMQRPDNGRWIWVEIPPEDHAWQQGPQRVEEFSYTRPTQKDSLVIEWWKARRKKDQTPIALADGTTKYIASRPCGHPGYQLAPQSEEETGIHGTARALSDADLADMNAMHHPGPIVGPQPGDMPPVPDIDSGQAPAPSTHGSSRPLSDDDLRRMGASGPNLNDPSSLGGIL